MGVQIPPAVFGIALIAQLVERCVEATEIAVQVGVGAYVDITSVFCHGCVVFADGRSVIL